MSKTLEFTSLVESEVREFSAYAYALHPETDHNLKWVEEAISAWVLKERDAIYLLLHETADLPLSSCLERLHTCYAPLTISLFEKKLERNNSHPFFSYPPAVRALFFLRYKKGFKGEKLLRVLPFPREESKVLLHSSFHSFEKNRQLTQEKQEEICLEFSKIILHQEEFFLDKQGVERHLSGCERCQRLLKERQRNIQILTDFIPFNAIATKFSSAFREDFHKKLQHI
ncbi:MAG: hypothetical protein KBD63_04275 [Bacteriovoracaceae bacterium]|nr:hypothetical protein [Bacteriovoracaceae bacterium]